MPSLTIGVSLAYSLNYGNTVFYSEWKGDYMELSENERLMLVKKKEDIHRITSEILTKKMTNPEKISKMNEIISILSTIESYAKPDRDLSVFSRSVAHIAVWSESGMDTSLLTTTFCTAVNSIQFDFTKRRLKFPETIIVNIENVLAKLSIPK
jgi:hypothetical protein